LIVLLAAGVPKYAKNLAALKPAMSTDELFTVDVPAVEPVCRTTLLTVSDSFQFMTPPMVIRL
jgi:hypothetical protein